MQVHEALLHRPTFAISEALSRSEESSISSLHAIRLAKLRRLLGHAAAHCPYYSERQLPSPDSITAFGDLAAITLITRDDLRRHAQRMRWPGAPSRLLIGRTHGTADDPLAFYWDRHRQAWDKANRLRAHRWHGFVPGDRELHLWPLDPPLSWPARFKQWVRDRRDDLCGDLQIDSLQASKERLPLTWLAWREFDPVCVTAYPSALAQLITEGRRVGCRIGNPSLRSVFLTGEVTFAWQRKLIERELGVPTIQDYGVQEAGALAYECPHGQWHLSAESVVIEIVRGGRPAEPGEYGEIVVTGLESLAMPILRYCTGDIVRVPENSSGPARGRSLLQTGQKDESAHGPTCRCGRTLPVLPPVVGRAADFLESMSGEWIEPAKVLDSLGAILEHGTFQVVQAGDGGVEIRVAQAAAGDTGRNMRPNREQEAVEHVRDILGPGSHCVVRHVSALTRSLFGKCRYVSSERTAGGLARS
jgi:phenylacetate-CoA ligase